MLMSRGSIVLNEETMEWYYRIRLVDNEISYFIGYYYRESHWCEPTITHSRSEEIKASDLIRLKQYLNHEDQTIQKWLREDLPTFLDYVHLSNNAKLKIIKRREGRRYEATFHKTKLKIGIDFENRKNPSFSIVGKGFWDFRQKNILLKYPDLIRQILEHSPQKLRNLLYI